MTHVVGLLLSLLGTTTKTEDEVECGFLLDVIVAEGATVFELLASEDQALLVGWDATIVSANASTDSERYIPLLILDFGLDIIDGVRGLHLKGDSLAREATQNQSERIKGRPNNTYVFTKICIFNQRTLLSVQRAQRWSLRQKQVPVR